MAGSKIERLLSMIFLLINREKVTAKELADYFSVSVKTIYRDIETLSLASIPVTSFPGVHGGYGILRDYVVDKNMFSYEEIVSALSVLGSIGSFFNDPAIALVSEKITSLIDAGKKDELKRLAGEMIFDLSAWGDGEPTQKKLNIIREAMRERRLLSFNYTNRSGESIGRIVEPINILFKERAWYMKGYCRIRKDIRTFKLTRIAGLTLSDETFKQDNNKYDMKKVENNIINNSKDVKVIMKIEKDVRCRVEDQIDAERIYEENGQLFAQINYPDEEELYSMILSFGDKVEVIEPDYVKAAVKNMAARVFAKYE